MVRGVEMHHSNNKTFKDITKLQQQQQKLQASITGEHREKGLNKILANHI